MDSEVEVRGMALRGTDIVLYFQDPEYPYGVGSICHTYGEPLHIPEHWVGWELASIDFGESAEIHRTFDRVKRELSVAPPPAPAAADER